MVDINSFKTACLKSKTGGRRTRSSSYLCPRMQELGNESGWELIQEWSQNTPMVWKEPSERLTNFMKLLSHGEKNVEEFMTLRA